MAGGDRAHHAAAAVPQDSCEPRAKLMWSIVGQVSSVSWQDVQPGSSACSADTTAPPPAAPSSVAGPQSEADSAISSPGDASEHPQQERAAAEAGAAPASPWADLRPEMLVMVASCAGTSKAAQAMVGVCRHWRAAILDDPHCLRRLRVPPPQSSLAASRLIAAGAAFPRGTGLPLTLLVDRAAKAGNLGACLAAAKLLDSLAMPQCMRFWKKAAQLGDPRAQVTYGTAAYAGSRGVTRDSEVAHRWLSKASGRLAALPSSGANGALLARAALHLGFLALDGEATRVDLEGAVSWFRLAAKCGSRDAEVALGTMLRTGQYGPS